MGLLRDGRRVEDAYVDVTGIESPADWPAGVPILVGLGQWQAARETLLGRGTPLGVRLASDQHPEAIAADLGALSLVALEFPRFRDGRAYSYARLLRERYGFGGELRAVGDVLLEQLHYMQRCGFDAFDIDSDDPEEAFRIASADFSVWYQPTADGRAPAFRLRQTR